MQIDGRFCHHAKLLYAEKLGNEKKNQKRFRLWSTYMNNNTYFAYARTDAQMIVVAEFAELSALKCLHWGTVRPYIFGMARIAMAHCKRDIINDMNMDNGGQHIINHAEVFLHWQSGGRAGYGRIARGSNMHGAPSWSPTTPAASFMYQLVWGWLLKTDIHLPLRKHVVYSYMWVSSLPY